MAASPQRSVRGVRNVAVYFCNHPSLRLDKYSSTECQDTECRHETGAFGDEENQKPVKREKQHRV